MMRKLTVAQYAPLILAVILKRNSGELVVLTFLVSSVKHSFYSLSSPSSGNAFCFQFFETRATMKMKH